MLKSSTLGNDTDHSLVLEDSTEGTMESLQFHESAGHGNNNDSKWSSMLLGISDKII